MVTTTGQFFGTFEGKEVKKYTIKQEEGIQVSIINYGAAITNILVTDQFGKQSDVVLGFDTLDGYIQAGNFYFGGICGRYANRIANGQFTWQGITYQLPKNAGENCLHGGIKGFDKVYWDAEILPGADGVKLTYQSPESEEGFPGNLTVHVIYRAKENALVIEFEAFTDKATPVNLTNHSYFNLSGGLEKDISGHELMINADRVIEVDKNLIPTGKLPDVKNTDFDFTSLIELGKKLQSVSGFDYTWIINKKKDELIPDAKLIFRKGNIQMNIFTDQPGIHFYSGHFLDNIVNTKNGIKYGKFAGLCLETQHFPDSPNKNNFPDTILKPGESYTQKTIYSFSSITGN